MDIIRHPELAEDIREISNHYAEISKRVLEGFWGELDKALITIESNPRRHHYDTCGLRRANFHRYPYHLLYEIDGNSIYLLVLRHDRRHPAYGLDRKRS